MMRCRTTINVIWQKKHPFFHGTMAPSFRLMFTFNNVDSLFSFSLRHGPGYELWKEMETNRMYLFALEIGFGAEYSTKHKLKAVLGKREKMGSSSQWNEREKKKNDEEKKFHETTKERDSNHFRYICFLFFITKVGWTFLLQEA